MIELHRLGHAEAFHLNPDLIVSIECCPDSVLTLSTGSKLLVAESPDEVVEAVRTWHAAVLADALGGVPPALAYAR